MLNGTPYAMVELAGAPNWQKISTCLLNLRTLKARPIMNSLSRLLDKNRARWPRRENGVRLDRVEAIRHFCSRRLLVETEFADASNETIFPSS